MISATIHVRLDPSSLTRLKAVAAAHQRSVAWWAARLIDEGLDRPETPPKAPEQQQPKAPVAIERRSRRIVFGAPKIPDLVYAAIEEALIEHGMNLTDGRQIMQWTTAVPFFRAKRPGHRPDLDRDQFKGGMKTLLEEGAICRDEALVWLPDAAPATPEHAEAPIKPTVVLSPWPPVGLGFARAPEKFLAVLRQALIDKGFDKIGDGGAIKRAIQVSDLRQAFAKSRPDHPAFSNKNAFHRVMGILVGQGVVVRDGELVWMT